MFLFSIALRDVFCDKILVSAVVENVVEGDLAFM